MHIEERDGQYCVISDMGEQVGCYASRADAAQAMQSMMQDMAADQAGTPFTALVCVENMETCDHRLFESPITWLDRPVPFMVQDVTAPEHDGAWFAGQISRITHDPDEPTRIIGRGNLLDNERGQQAEEMIRGGLRGISMDAGYEDRIEEIVAATAEQPQYLRNRFRGTQVMGATATSIPAFSYGTIWFDDEDAPPWIDAQRGTANPPPLAPQPDMPMTLLASAPARPPAEWFDNPGFTLGDERLVASTEIGVFTVSQMTAAGLDPNAPGSIWGCPLIVTDDGQVYGHIATWQACHTGHPVCITAPTSPSGYAYFHTGEVVCDDGSRVAVGQLTAGGGHADGACDARQTVAHYDSTSYVVADVHAYEDEFGIAVAGAVRPNLTDDGYRALMAAAPSGDWRRINGYLELIAVLCVNAPGFPVPRAQARLVASAGEDVQTSLVAAPGPPVVPLERPVAAISRLTSLVERIDLLERRLDAARLRNGLITPDVLARLDQHRADERARRAADLRASVTGVGST